MQMNPNFFKKPEGIENTNTSEIEIFEPKKKSVFNPESYKIAQPQDSNKDQESKKFESSPISKDQVKNEVKRKESNISFPTNSKLDKANKDPMKRKDSNVNNNGVESTAKKDQAELKKFLKEMREKKKKENQEESNIEVKWVEPKKGFSNKNFETNSPQQCEENFLELKVKETSQEEDINFRTTADQQFTLDDIVQASNEDRTTIEVKNVNEFTLKNTNFEYNRDFDDTSHTDYSKIESQKIALENELGDIVFAGLFRKIDDLIEEGQSFYDHSMLGKLKEELFELEDEKIDLCLRKVPEIFDLVLKERIAVFNANK